MHCRQVGMNVFTIYSKVYEVQVIHPGYSLSFKGSISSNALLPLTTGLFPSVFYPLHHIVTINNKQHRSLNIACLTLLALRSAIAKYNAALLLGDSEYAVLGLMKNGMDTTG